MLNAKLSGFLGVLLAIVACATGATRDSGGLVQWAEADQLIAAAREVVPPKPREDERTFSPRELGVVSLHLKIDSFYRSAAMARVSMLMAERTRKRGQDPKEFVMTSIEYLERSANECKALVSQILAEGYGEAADLGRARDRFLDAVASEREHVSGLSR